MACIPEYEVFPSFHPCEALLLVNPMQVLLSQLFSELTLEVIHNKSGVLVLVLVDDYRQ
jgi:hypothetical protein